MFLSKKFTSMLVLFCILVTIRALATKWPITTDGKNSIVCYVIDKASNYTASDLALIQQAMDDIEKVTCIRFRKRTNQKNFIRIFSGDGCHSPVGVQGGSQNVTLNTPHCMIRKKVVHELIHSIGFNHMHERFDRDKHIDILWGNISQKDKKWFGKLNNRDESFNTMYDYLSCMHYTYYAFAKNGGKSQFTILTKDPAYRTKIGNVTTLSVGDARRINRMYKCRNMGTYA